MTKEQAENKKPSEKCQEILKKEKVHLMDYFCTRNLLIQLDSHWQEQFNKGMDLLEGKNKVIERAYKEIDELKAKRRPTFTKIVGRIEGKYNTIKDNLDDKDEEIQRLKKELGKFIMMWHTEVDANKQEMLALLDEIEKIGREGTMSAYAKLIDILKYQKQKRKEIEDGS